MPIIIQHNPDQRTVGLSQLGSGDLFWNHGAIYMKCQETTMIKGAPNAVRMDTGSFLWIGQSEQVIPISANLRLHSVITDPDDLPDGSF